MTLSHQEPSCIQYTFKRKKRRGFPSAMEVRLTKAWSDAITEKKSKLTWKGRVSLICFFSLNTGSSTRHFGPKTGCQEPKLYSVLEYEAWRMLCLPIVLQAWIAQKWNIFAGSPTNEWEKIKNLRKSQSFLGSKLAWKTEVPRKQKKEGNPNQCDRVPLQSEGDCGRRSMPVAKDVPSSPTSFSIPFKAGYKL